jgi:hypothetical protein
MTRPHAKAQHHKRKPVKPARQQENDVAVYIGLLMIGLFSIALFGTLYQTWQVFTVGYIIAILFLINLYGWRAYLGRELAGWQRSLAKLPLRFAGFGNRHGHPLSAAKGQPPARTALVVCLIVSAAIAAAATYLLVPDIFRA